MTTPRRNTTVLVIAGALVISLAMGLRGTLGLFQAPMIADLGVGRETFGFAMALQQIVWGIFQPFCGMVADRYGSGRVLVAGSVVYMAGLFVMSGAESALGLNFGGGWLIGFGLAATSFSVVLGALGRLVPPEKQSVAFGIATAGGSVGQFILAPIGQSLIQSHGWAGALAILSIMASLIAVAATVLRSKAGDEAGSKGSAVSQATMKGAVFEATANKNYIYLTLGFFVCGFQVSFMTMHLPAYLSDIGLGTTAAIALALIGFFNIIGTYACGALGGRYSKRYLLSLLYFFRSIVVLLFMIAPKTELVVYIFSGTIGLLWLGTVPLTSGLVAQIFGVRYMSTLFGIVFFSHQVGSFIGVWMGGYLYDVSGSYDGIWYGSVVLGIAAALIHLPIVEKPLRTQLAET